MKILLTHLILFTLLEASALTILTNPAPEIAVAHNGDVHLNWDVLNSHSYDVYYSTNLTKPFELSIEDIRSPQTNYIDTTHRSDMCVFYKVTTSLIGPNDVHEFLDDATLLQIHNQKYLYLSDFKYPLIQAEGPSPYSYMVGDHALVSFPPGILYGEVQNWANSNGYVIREYHSLSDVYLIQKPIAQLDVVYQIISDIAASYPTANATPDYIYFGF